VNVSEKLRDFMEAMSLSELGEEAHGVMMARLNGLEEEIGLGLRRGVWEEEDWALMEQRGERFGKVPKRFRLDGGESVFRLLKEGKWRSVCASFALDELGVHAMPSAPVSDVQLYVGSVEWLLAGKPGGAAGEGFVAGVGRLVEGHDDARLFVEDVRVVLRLDRRRLSGLPEFLSEVMNVSEQALSELDEFGSKMGDRLHGVLVQLAAMRGQPMTLEEERRLGLEEEAVRINSEWIRKGESWVAPHLHRFVLGRGGCGGSLKQLTSSLVPGLSLLFGQLNGRCMANVVPQTLLEAEMLMRAMIYGGAAPEGFHRQTAGKIVLYVDALQRAGWELHSMALSRPWEILSARQGTGCCSVLSRLMFDWYASRQGREEFVGG
jgi:hypothetical protein